MPDELPLYDQDQEPSTLFSIGRVPAQANPDECRCTQMWPGHPCGYCHPKR